MAFAVDIFFSMKCRVWKWKYFLQLLMRILTSQPSQILEVLYSCHSSQRSLSCNSGIMNLLLISLNKRLMSWKWTWSCWGPGNVLFVQVQIMLKKLLLTRPLRSLQELLRLELFGWDYLFLPLDWCDLHMPLWDTEVLMNIHFFPIS